VVIRPNYEIGRFGVPRSWPDRRSEQEFLGQSAAASLEVARLLARRLDSLSKYLIDVKRQYEGHDHLGMVDEVIEALMHLPPRKRPSSSS